MRGPRTTAMVGLCTVIASACSEPEALCDSFTSTLAIKDKFDQPADVFIVGEPIRIELQLTNRNRTPVKLSSDGCPPVLFSVSDRVGETVWTSMDGVACTLILRYITFAPLETKSFGTEWSQGVRGGSQAPEGSYRGQTESRFEGCPFDSAGFSIR